MTVFNFQLLWEEQGGGEVRRKTDKGIKERDKYRYEMKKPDGGVSDYLKHFDILNPGQFLGSK